MVLSNIRWHNLKINFEETVMNVIVNLFWLEQRTWLGEKQREKFWVKRRRRRKTSSININFHFVQQKRPNRILSGFQSTSNCFVIHNLPLCINMEYFKTKSQQSLGIMGNVDLPHLFISKRLDLTGICGHKSNINNE